MMGMVLKALRAFGPVAIPVAIFAGWIIIPLLIAFGPHNAERQLNAADRSVLSEIAWMCVILESDAKEAVVEDYIYIILRRCNDGSFVKEMMSHGRGEQPKLPAMLQALLDND